MSKNPFDDDADSLSVMSMAAKSRGIAADMTQSLASPNASSSTIKPMDAILQLSALCENGRKELVDILMSLRGRKCLVLEPQLGGLLNIILPDSGKGLKEHGVTYVRELKSEDADSISSSDSAAAGNALLLRDIPENIVYLVRPNLALIKVIAKQIKAYRAASTRCQFHIYFIPHRTVVCEQILEDEDVLNLIEIGEYHLNFIPFEGDIVTLEMDNVFRQCYVDGDTSPLNIIARALCRFQSQFGVIPHVKSKGAASRKVVQKMFHMRREEEISNNQHSHDKSQPFDALNSEIDTVVILDREVDLVSAFVTPLTYEGLIDEIINIENNRIKVETAIAGEEKDDSGQSTAPPSSNIINSSTSTKASGAPQASNKVTVVLDDNDIMYSEVRNLSIERLGMILQEKAIKIRERYSNFRENKDASISEIHDFVKKIPHLTKEFKYLQRHINIAGFLKSFTDSREFREMWQGERGILEGEPYLDQIEDMICADVDCSQMLKILRLLCLQSLTSGGIRTARYESIKRLIVQNYGYEELFTLTNLERAGLLKKKDVVLVDGPSVWQGLRKQLRLIDEDTGREELSYVAAGYAPMLVRLVQALGKSNGWSSILDAMRLLPGPLLEVTQQSLAEELIDALHRSNDSTNTQQNALTMMGEDNRETSKRNLFVVVIGGLTFLEIAAFRFLSKDPNFPYRIIMGTTKLITGTSLLKSLRYSVKIA